MSVLVYNINLKPDANILSKQNHKINQQEIVIDLFSSDMFVYDRFIIRDNKYIQLQTSRIFKTWEDVIQHANDIGAVCWGDIYYIANYLNQNRQIKSEYKMEFNNQLFTGQKLEEKFCVNCANIEKLDE